MEVGAMKLGFWIESLSPAAAPDEPIDAVANG
jgi:hypothetical protein